MLEAFGRFGTDSDQAIPISGGGWILPGFSSPYIPGIKQVASSAFPAPTGSLDVSDLMKLGSLSSGTSIHLAWTALAALGVGLLLRGRRWAKLFGLLPIGVACGLHTLHNYVAVNSRSPAEPLNSALENVLWLVPLVGLAIAMALDLKTLHRAESVGPHVLISGERPGPSAVLRFSLTAVPWTVWIALRFILVRRSLWFLTARTTPAVAEPLRVVVAELVTEMQAAGNRQAWRGLYVRQTLLAALGWKRRALLAIVWLALMIPALLVAIVGSFPSRAGLQQSLATGAGAKVTLVSAVGAIVWILWRLIAGLFEVRRTAKSPLGELIAAARLRVLVALGALSVGTLLLYLRLTGTELDGHLALNAHLLDALDDVLLIVGFTLTVLALFALFPPGALALATGGVITTAITTEAATALGLSGVLLMTAGARGRSSAGTSGTSRPADSEPQGLKQEPPAEMPVVADTKLQNLIKNLYKGTTNPKRTGDGTTMDAVRNELLTGRRTHWTRHIQKAEQTKRDLGNWVAGHPDASPRDIRIAKALMKRLTNALNTKRPN